MRAPDVSPETAVTNDESDVPRWLVWSTLAIVATLAHVLIDAHIGLWGETSDEMSVLQATNLGAQGVVYGWWALALVFAARGDRWGMRSALVMAAGNAFLLHGAIAIVAAPPPSAAFPYQDLAHGLSLVTGGVAAVYIWSGLKNAPAGGRRYLFIGSILAIILSQALSGAVFMQYA